MPAFNTLHNELRLRVPGKPYELYDDVIRWAINRICVKTALWQKTTEVITTDDSDTYSLIDLENRDIEVIHSILYIVQEGNTDRVIRRPVNGFITTERFGALSDYLKAFRTHSTYQVQIAPYPKDGGITLQVTHALKPTSSATEVGNDKFFDEYKNTVISGALYRLYEDDSSFEQADRREKKFNNGISSIHIDVLKENADTPFRLNVGW